MMRLINTLWYVFHMVTDLPFADIQYRKRHTSLSRTSWGGSQARGQTTYHEGEICMRMTKVKTKRSTHPIGMIALIP